MKNQPKFYQDIQNLIKSHFGLTLVIEEIKSKFIQNYVDNKTKRFQYGFLWKNNEGTWKQWAGAFKTEDSAALSALRLLLKHPNKESLFGAKPRTLEEIKKARQRS